MKVYEGYVEDDEEDKKKNRCWRCTLRYNGSLYSKHSFFEK